MLTFVAFFTTVKGCILIGHRLRARAQEGQREQVITGVQAMLALTGFLLAVSFTLAETRFGERKALVLKEANAIGTAYLRADFLPRQAADKTKALLREYVETRMSAKSIDTTELERILSASENIQKQLWMIAAESGRNEPGSTMINLYVESLNALIDLHSERVTVGLIFHISKGLMFTLFLATFFTLGVLGLSFGLKGARKVLPASGPIILFAVILLMILDLDQPKQRFFEVSQKPLVEVLKSMK